jgi:predicted kinase
MSFTNHYFVEGDEVPDLILTIGIPGSGKSRWINEINKDNKYIIVEPDAIRKEMTGNVSDQSKNGAVWDVAKKRVVANLRQKHSVILDATNVNSKNRKQFIQGLPACNLKAKIFHVDPSVSKERIRKDIASGKDRSNVPDDVIDRMYMSFKDTLGKLEGEGFTIIK